MTYELGSFKAGGTIRPSRFVKISTSADNEVLEADANEQVIGVASDATQDAPIPNHSSNAAEDGDQIHLNPIGSVCLLEAGTGGWTAGANLKSDADGKGVLVATTGTTIQEIGGIAHSAISAGEFGLVTVHLGSRRPALS